MQSVNSLLEPSLNHIIAETAKMASPAYEGRRGHTHYAWSAAAEGTLPYRMSKAAIACAAAGSLLATILRSSRMPGRCGSSARPSCDI
jgi:hypothetical protein